MCGICGVMELEGAIDPRLLDAVPSMTDAMEHRGPDAGGLFRDDHAALGHRRLSIIDRAGGGQPLANENDTVWIVFNGEIYNHHDLRARLIARGHQFKTVSDTETILHGYEEYGSDVVDHLDGMFAFAIYDTTRRELFIARDRLGKKPLFYALFGGALHFASELGSLFRSAVWNGAINAEALEDYLSLGYTLAPHTIFKHVRKLEPGHWLRVAGGRIETREYWDITRFDDDPRDEAVLEQELEALLGQTVRDRLESEVPLGAFLSGGIDSGLVVSYMAEALGPRLVTTSVGFGVAGFDELTAAGETARHFNARHYPEVVDPRLDDVLTRIVSAFGEPFADSSAIPTFYVSQAARRHVTVALTGDGGDETFGGYGFRYLPHMAEGYARALGGRGGQAICRWLAKAWPRGRRVPRAFRIGTLLENVGRDPASAYYFDLCFMKPNATRALMGLPPVSHLSDTRVYEAVTAPYRRCPSTSEVQRAMYADLKVYLPNDVLVKVDRMSMQHGLEVRCPLLDRRVVEFGFRVPASTKMRGWQPKRMLRSIAARRLPATVARLPKQGFSAPVGAWIAGPYASRFRDEVLGPSAAGGLLDRDRIARLFEDHRAGRADHSYALWAAWMLERWRADLPPDRTVDASASGASTAKVR